MSYLPRSALIASVLLAASVDAAPPRPNDNAPELPKWERPPQGHPRGVRSSRYTKRQSPKRSKKLEAKLRKRGRKAARRG